MVNKAKITWFACDLTHQTLGYHICPKGNMKRKAPSADIEYFVKYMLAINWATFMNVANLTRQELHIAYQGVLQAQLRYSPVTTTFIKTQLQPIQTIIDQAYKPETGLNKKFPTEVFQGPQEFNRLSTIPLITTRGYKQTQLLIGSLQNDNDTEKLTTTTLQYKQLDSGQTTPILGKRTTLDYQKGTKQLGSAPSKHFSTL